MFFVWISKFWKCIGCLMHRFKQQISGWWLNQPIWKKHLVKLDHLPRDTISWVQAPCHGPRVTVAFQSVRIFRSMKKDIIPGSLYYQPKRGNPWKLLYPYDPCDWYIWPHLVRFYGKWVRISVPWILWDTICIVWFRPKKGGPIEWSLSLVMNKTSNHPIWATI